MIFNVLFFNQKYFHNMPQYGHYIVITTTEKSWVRTD